MNEATHMATNQIKTVSDSRDQKARMSGDYEAYAKDQAAIRFQKARKEYLQNNPEVGTLIRNGKEVFYRNLQPLHLGLTEEFTPESVISPTRAERAAGCNHKQPTKTMTKAKINRAIKHLNLEVEGARGDGYFYFLSLTTGSQVGESVYVCYLNQLTLGQWVEEAAHVETPAVGIEHEDGEDGPEVHLHA